MELTVKNNDEFLSTHVPIEYREHVLFTVLNDLRRSYESMCNVAAFSLFVVNGYDYHEYVMECLMDSMMEVLQTLMAIPYGREYSELTDDEKEEIDQEHCNYYYYYKGVYKDILIEVMTHYHYFHGVFLGDIINDDQGVDYAYHEFVNSPLQEVW